MQLHDNDEYVAADSEATFGMGQASFTFRDFLRPFCRELKLRAEVFPVKRADVDNTLELDLNSTARKGEKTVDIFSPYLMNSTYFVIKADLAYPIGIFNEEKELLEIQMSIKS